MFCGLVKPVPNLSAGAVVTHPVLRGALSRCLTPSSSCWVLLRAAVAARLGLGFGLKQGAQSSGAAGLPVGEEVHGATPAQARAPSRPPQGDVLLALPLPQATVHEALCHLKPPAGPEFLRLYRSLLLLMMKMKMKSYLGFGARRFSSPGVALVTVGVYK